MRRKDRRAKSGRRKIKLGLPELEYARTAVLNSLRSLESQRSYQHSINEFVDWYCSSPRLSFNKAVVTRYRIHLDVGHSMEDAFGIRAINSSVERLARAEDLPMRAIDFIIYQQGEKNSKNTNIALLASAMRGPQDPVTKKFARGNVFISTNIPHIDEIKRQFEKWSVNAKRRKDDAPDCIAQIWKHYRDLIRPDAVAVMQERPPQSRGRTSASPDLHDPHADESIAETEYGDSEYLDSDTTHFFA